MIYRGESCFDIYKDKRPTTKLNFSSLEVKVYFFKKKHDTATGKESSMRGLTEGISTWSEIVIVDGCSNLIVNVDGGYRAGILWSIGR